MFSKISRYWLFQFIGWGIMFANSVFWGFQYNRDNKTVYFISVLLTCILGILFTHVMRMVIHRLKVLEKPLPQQVWSFIFLTIIFAGIWGVSSEVSDILLGYEPKWVQERGYSIAERLFFSSFNSLWLIGIWNLIYYLYHYIQQNRKNELDTLRLEALVKSLELKTIKSHVNPHFIFNALNSIRALVDENPQRARQAITELSNILRSSLRAEKLETVPLEHELDIVQDYLALEQMRFEERLKVEMDIDPKTLQQQVPPMMLQTIVENAIKHGISKQLNGGLVKISSSLNDNSFQVTVTNSGQLSKLYNNHGDGFGLKSTQDRLNLLYQGKAHFEIIASTDNTVESTITMPKTEINHKESSLSHV